MASALIGYLRYGLLHNCFSELFTRVAVERKDVASDYEYRFIVLISELKFISEQPTRVSAMLYAVELFSRC